jgi:hypothetical protein
MHPDIELRAARFDGECRHIWRHVTQFFLDRSNAPLTNEEQERLEMHQRRVELITGAFMDSIHFDKL